MRGMSGHNYRPAIEFTRKADVLRLRTSQTKEAKLPRALDHALERRPSSARPSLQTVFIPALVNAGIDLNRKMLSEMAIADPGRFF